MASVLKLFCVVCLAWALSACATSGSRVENSVNDPYEEWNRSVFAFNKKVDRNFLDPVTNGYVAITPEPVQDGVSNVVVNLRQPLVFVNALLQGNFVSAGDTLVRFLVNSTIGIGGLFDVASDADVPRHSEDFGQTLGVWGVKAGPHIELPFFGPSNGRDAFGLAVSIFADPATLVINNELGFAAVVTVVAIDALDTRRLLDRTIDQLYLEKDPYAFSRSAYRQARRFAICNGRCPIDAEDDDLFDSLDYGDDDISSSGNDRPLKSPLKDEKQ